MNPSENHKSGFNENYLKLNDPETRGKIIRLVSNARDNIKNVESRLNTIKNNLNIDFDEIIVNILKILQNRGVDVTEDDEVKNEIKDAIAIIVNSLKLWRNSFSSIKSYVDQLDNNLTELFNLFR